MLLETILNDCYFFKHFKYRRSRFEEQLGEKYIVVDILHRIKSKGLCPECLQGCPTYDHQDQRIFHFIPLLGYRVEIYYEPRRVTCSVHGIHVEHMPWADGKSTLTNAFKLFMAHWAKKLSWKEVGEAFRVRWHQVMESVKHVVDYGLKHRNLENIETLGIDEIQYQKGHKYLTLVYQTDADNKRLLWIGKERKAKTLLRFFRWFGKDKTEKLKAICCDMWKPYLKVIKKKASHVLNILDRFHIMKMMNEAIDQTRKQEVQQFYQNSEENILHKSKWCLLKNPENLTETQAVKMKELLKRNLQSIKAYLLREVFQKFWIYETAAWAEKFFDRWTFTAIRSKIDPVKKVVKTLRRHKENILNWFRTEKRISNGIVEGFNGKAKLTMRKSYGFRTYEILELALYHALGNLPEPEFTHRFW